jgi:GT2 family glycosyltransferase
MNSLTVVVPFWNGHKTIESLLDSLPGELPVIVVDDQSDNALSIDRPNVRVVRSEKKGYFTGACNWGIGLCETDVLILNQDTQLHGTAWLDLLSTGRETYAMIGERIRGNHPAWPNGYIHGTFMFIRRDAWNEVGPMNAIDYPLWGSTCEWQLRAARKGYKILPLATIPGFVHERKQKAFGESITQMLERSPELRQWLVRTPPAVSVVINCYNHGKYLADAVHSLIGGPTSLGDAPGQTFQSFEVVIVDDGSTDNTPEVGKALVDPWKAVRYIRQNNAGSATACNSGINASYGKYIAPLDSDDMMLPNRLENMYRLQLDNPHSVVFDDLLTFDKTGIHKNGHGEPRVWQMPTYDFYKIVWKNTMHKGLMFPKEAWREVGGYPEVMNKGREDWAFNVGLGRLGWCGVKTAEAGYLYRREGQNRTLINTTPYWRWKFLDQLTSIYPDVYNGRYPMGCCGGNKQAYAKQNSKRTLAGGIKGMKQLPGQSGMIKMRYEGANAGNSSFWGPVTGIRYVFGGGRKEGYVDEFDVPGMLDIYQGSRQLFVLVADSKTVEKEPVEYVPVAPEIPETFTAPVKEELEIEPEAAIDLEGEPAPVDPSEHTVKSLTDAIEGLSVHQIEKVLIAEKEGAARTTAIKMLEEAMVPEAMVAV